MRLGGRSFQSVHPRSERVLNYICFFLYPYPYFEFRYPETCFGRTKERDEADGGKEALGEVRAAGTVSRGV